MLFAGSSWSELPISTYKPQELNGDEYLYTLIIDQILPVDFEIEQQEDFSVYIKQQDGFTIKINQEEDLNFNISQEFEFDIDFKE